jgi:hypothetical protein
LVDEVPEVVVADALAVVTDEEAVVGVAECGICSDVAVAVMDLTYLGYVRVCSDCRNRGLDRGCSLVDEQEVEVDEEDAVDDDDDDDDYHICGETGGCIVIGSGCKKRVLADDTYMLGNTSYCSPCYDEYESEYYKSESE